MSDQLKRRLGLTEAVALNMSNMVGVGPFITIPLIIASMGGPQCMLGWLLGAILSVADGLVWSELSAALPGTGGSYVYLREAFRGTRFGGLLPFLFIWQFVLSGPLEISSGLIGFAQYSGYLLKGMGAWGMRGLAIGVGLVVMLMLYRRIEAIGRLTVVLWVGMLATVLVIIVSGLANFNAKVAFDFPPGAFHLSRSFFGGLGAAMLIAMYDFMGYFDICYVAGEVRDPGRVIPRSILWSVAAVAVMYALTNLSIISVVPWREAMQSKFIAADFMERLYGAKAAAAVTLLVLWTALASVFALLLGYSRIIWAAAKAGDFFAVFARLHPTGNFPHVAVLVLGTIAIAGSFFTLDDVIPALLTTRILVQFMGQIWALHRLRSQPGFEMPFRMWWYPVPSIIAFLGWLYIFSTSGGKFIAFGILTLLVGIAAWWLKDRELQAEQAAIE